MRPVNLIPPESRSEGRPLRNGPLVYVVIGLLVAALVGVAALVVTENQISDRQAEVAQLRREEAAVNARVQRLAAYTQFRTLREQEVSTVTNLANSRFDWERVMRELSLVLPSDVWLSTLNASAAPDASVGSGGSTMRSAIAGPALELTGCTIGHDGVAGFITALKDIDGVTRVGVESSDVAEKGGGGEGGGGSSGGSGGCQTQSFVAQFKLVVAFDAAPTPNEAPAAAEAAPTTAPPAESTTPEEG